MQGQKVSVIFDGTSWTGEAMAVILRFVDKDWEIQHHLIVSQLFAKSMTGEEIACELISVLQLQYDVRRFKLPGPCSCSDIVKFNHPPIPYC